MDALSVFHLGPHHALTNRDLLRLLQYTCKLEELDLFYDNFLNTRLPDTDKDAFTGLEHLHKLVIRHQGVASKSQYLELFSWLEVVVSASPLTSFSILSDDERECKFAMPLVHLLCMKAQLEFLNIPQIVLRQSSLRILFENLKRLRVLSIMLVDVNILRFHTSVAQGQLTELKALYLWSDRAICSYSLVTSPLCRTMSSLRGGAGYLRRLSQQKQTWKVSNYPRF
ncbi:hypothetical protein BDP27DRAFT_1028681 [Rhodocollybia butyracea]|uniref:Uncharacterized protein n=1 Tax=Rhodocollybia butyracea TaxID=206335 RepID=A0A9P5UDP6_9AGAR|nr:hypothetical protein BDP27DRAFT_1028681 [Rhodocollybia butyracea]